MEGNLPLAVHITLLGPHADPFQILGLVWVCFHLKKFTSLAAYNVTETYSAFRVLFVDTYFMFISHSTLF